MITRTSNRTLPSSAPPIVFELREAFDARLLDLHKSVLDTMATEPPAHADQTVHVFFNYGMLRVTAVYDCVEERLTQLIARDADEDPAHVTSYTLSLFL